jgi:nitrogen regulatory protein PII
MQLLIAVINEPDRIDDVLAGFLDLGITGATVIASEGMGRVLSTDLPIFAGLQAFASGSRPQNTTIFSVIADDRVAPALTLLREVVGDLADPATGIAFVLPVNQVVGLAPALSDADDDAHAGGSGGGASGPGNVDDGAGHDPNAGA